MIPGKHNAIQVRLLSIVLAGMVINPIVRPAIEGFMAYGSYANQADRYATSALAIGFLICALLFVADGFREFLLSVQASAVGYDSTVEAAAGCFRETIRNQLIPKRIVRSSETDIVSSDAIHCVVELAPGTTREHVEAVKALASLVNRMWGVAVLLQVNRPVEEGDADDAPDNGPVCLPVPSLN